jgi:hypothetical protein
LTVLLQSPDTRSCFHFGQDVRDVDDLSARDRLAGEFRSIEQERLGDDPLHPFWRVTMVGGELHAIALEQEDGALVGIAQFRRRLGERVQDGLQLESRAADDLEHFGGSRLLL